MSKRNRLKRTIELIASGVITAHPDFCTTSLDELAKICNGCGSASAKFDGIPDTFYGMYIGEACMVHDYDYYCGTTKQDKADADWRFLINLFKIIYHKSKWYNPSFLMCCRATLYYHMVRKLGNSAFWAGKVRPK